MTEEIPAHDRLADDRDQLGWDRAKHGLMADAAAPDDAVQTVPFVPGDDPR